MSWSRAAGFIGMKEHYGAIASASFLIVLELVNHHFLFEVDKYVLHGWELGHVTRFKDHLEPILLHDLHNITLAKIKNANRVAVRATSYLFPWRSSTFLQAESSGDLVTHKDVSMTAGHRSILIWKKKRTTLKTDILAVIDCTWIFNFRVYLGYLKYKLTVKLFKI